MANSPAIVVLSPSGLETAKKIRTKLENSKIHARLSEADVQFKDVKDHVQTLFKEGCPIIGLCASGILIRLLSSLLDDKWHEPPVLAVSETGSAVVPLLGGHHGANDLARHIAEALGVEAAVTTSGDLHFGVALDSPPEGYMLSNPEDAKSFMSHLLKGEKTQVYGNAPWLKESKLPFSDTGSLTISVTEKITQGDGRHLVYHPKTLVVGMGAVRGAPESEAIALVGTVLKENSLSTHSVAAVTSIDLKADETAIHAVAKHINVPARFFTKDELKVQEPNLENPSEIVRSEVGVAGVAEAAALAFGENNKLVVSKKKSTNTTIAIAKTTNPPNISYGRTRGLVSLIGVGPGSKAWRSAESVKLLREATDWVGYDLYLDLVEDLKTSQTEHRFPLGAEEKRVRHAMELAAQGKDVAVVCSGDPGIYAMATLAYELIDTGARDGELTEAARRVELIVAPGISAFQAAAARAGAPIGHDFCCISLSDLLTPRDDILKRLNAAAEGDFVTAFYNPRSKRRITLLDEAFEIYKKHRPDDTPIILATDLGREKENVRVVTLATVKSEDVDMLTLVMIGSSNSKWLETGDGHKWVYTPRGYNRKETP